MSGTFTQNRNNEYHIDIVICTFYDDILYNYTSSYLKTKCIPANHGEIH